MRSFQQATIAATAALVILGLRCHGTPDDEAGGDGLGKPASPVTIQHSPIVPGAELGALTGSFSVTGDGAATYTIPIAVPPGRAGIEPAVSLSYSSRSSARSCCRRSPRTHRARPTRRSR